MGTLRRAARPALPGDLDFAAALWELKADPRATIRTTWLRLGIWERRGESLAEFSRRYREWLTRQPALLRLPDRAGQRLVTAVAPLPGEDGPGPVVYAAQVGASGLLLLELAEVVGEVRWREFVGRVLRRLGGRPLWAVPPLALPARSPGPRVIGEVMGCRIAAPDPPAERVLLARVEAARNGAWPPGLGAASGLAETILRSWEDEVNGAPLPSLGRSSRELFERLDRRCLRPLHPGPASD